MAPSKVPPGLEKYTRLNPSIWYLHQPTTNQTQTQNQAPDLILLAGWMDASPRHLAKYTAGYSALYPNASILAITTTAYDAAFRSRASNLTRLAPALEILYSFPSPSSTQRPKILLHAFSNGGSLTSMLLASAYHEKTTRPPPISGLILDSCPGRATYARSMEAFAVGLPKNWVLNAIGQVLLRVAWVLYKLANWAMGKEDTVEGLRRDFNDEKLVAREVRRLYVYSESDPMVGWQDVEEHAGEAEARGRVVRKERFEGTGHCGHMIGDSVRYWGAVKDFWSSQ